MLDTKNITVIYSRYTRYLHCDKCNCQLEISNAYIVSCLPSHIKSTNKSSTFCRKCCNQVLELDNDRIECII